MKEQIEVRIVEMPDMTFACFPAYSPEPEDDAWKALEAWAVPLGFMDDRVRHRIFGFDTAGVTPGSPNRGYEFWIQVDPAFSAGESVQLKHFVGGKYAVYRIPKVGSPWETIPSAWKALVLWQEDSRFKMRHAPCLEEHLGAPGVPLADSPMDLYLSIE